MHSALREINIEGIQSNIALHRRIIDDAQFSAGGVHIHYLEALLDL
jgi:acetyl-CoA carboxylase biotin carboxylase subunit